jgi:hypothetical protein
MQRLIPVLLCSIALGAQAGKLIPLPSTQAIDLDKPGALEALQRDNPKHYEVVMKRVEQAQTVEYTDSSVHNLALFSIPDPASPFGPQGDLKLSDPAQSRIMVPVETSMYIITVRYTKDRAHLVPAR